MSYKQKELFGNWLNTYNFELLITVRLPPNLPMHDVHKTYMRDLLRPIAKFNKTKVGSCSVFVPATRYEQAHLHSLVCSYHWSLCTNIGPTVAYVKGLRSELNTHRDAIDIQPITYDCGVPYYTANHLTETAGFEFYNKWILDKKRKTGTDRIS